MHASLLFRIPLLSFFILSLLSCTPENSPVSSIPTEEVYIKINIPSLRQTLRSENQKDPMQRIESLEMLFFEGADMDSKLLEIRQFHLGSTDDNTEDILLKLPRREEYYLLCIANASAELKQLIQKGNKAEVFLNKEFVLATRRMTTNLSTEVLNGALMMTNAEGLIPVNESHYFKNEGDKSTARAVDIVLEPIAARVLLDPTLPRITNSSLRMKDKAKVRYIVTGVSKSIYWVRKTKTTTSSSLLSPLEEEYAYSPGYEEIAQSTGKDSYTMLIEKYRAFYSSPKSIFEYGVEVDPNIPTKNLEKSALYCKETTVDPLHFIPSFIPHIVVAYPIHPSDLTVAPDKGWIAFKGKFLTEEDFTNYVTSLKSNPNTPLPEGMPAEFATSVQKIKEHERVVKMDQPFSLEGIHFYWKSLNFYIWPLRHFDNKKAPEKNSFGRYGIVRNNEYTVRVQKISWFGSNTIPDLKNDMEAVSEYSSIKFSIEVKDLQQREQEVEA